MAIAKRHFSRNDEETLIKGFLTEEERKDVQEIYEQFNRIVYSDNPSRTMRITRIEFELEGINDESRVAKCGIVA